MMDLLFYVILIVVIVLKLVFWIFYFYARNRRQQILQQRTAIEQSQDRSRQYEEQPAVPQPAYMFTQYPFGPDIPATFLVPPEYAVEDPIKIDAPPPPYTVTPSIAREESEAVTINVDIGDSDTLQLVNNQEN